MENIVKNVKPMPGAVQAVKRFSKMPLAVASSSRRKDVVPVLNLGGYGVYIPFHVTWQHEFHDEEEIKNDRFYKINSIEELPKLLGL